MVKSISHNVVRKLVLSENHNRTFRVSNLASVFAVWKDFENAYTYWVVLVVLVLDPHGQASGGKPGHL